MAKSLLAACFILLWAAAAEGRTIDSERPNIIVVLADDLGWGDVGYNGGAASTPHIDALAREGVRLPTFYAMSFCTPTRAGLLTGRWPNRYGLMHRVVWPWTDDGLPPEALTLAEIAGANGYSARAIVGKWHLGHNHRRHHPLNQGFTSFLGTYNGEIDYFSRRMAGEVDWHRDFEPSTPQGYATDEISAEAERLIRTRAGAQGPYLLYVAYTAPHSPNQATAPLLARNASIGDPEKRLHAAMVTGVDDGVGRLRAALRDTGQDRNTIFLFLSDNGGDLGYGADNGPLRGQKGEGYEGGVRVPAIVRWPAGGLAGGGAAAGRMGYIDVAPTLVALAGMRADGAAFDGMDLSEAWRGGSPPAPRDWFTLRGSNAEEFGSVISGAYKLVRIGRSVAIAQNDADARISLFDLDVDPYERHDIAAERPDLVQDLLSKLIAFRALDPTNRMQDSLDGPPEATRAWFAERRAPATVGAAPPPHFDNTNTPIPGFTAPRDWRIPE